MATKKKSKLQKSGSNLLLCTDKEAWGKWAEANGLSDTSYSEYYLGKKGELTNKEISFMLTEVLKDIFTQEGCLIGISMIPMNPNKRDPGKPVKMDYHPYEIIYKGHLKRKVHINKPHYNAYEHQYNETTEVAGMYPTFVIVDKSIDKVLVEQTLNYFDKNSWEKTMGYKKAALNSFITLMEKATQKEDIISPLVLVDMLISRASLKQ